jgi:hypothetical protein
MAISDWTSQVTGNYVFLLETITPIAGTGSLRLERNSGTGAEGAIIYPTSLTTGITKGRLQTIIHLEDMTDDSGVEQNVGMFFMIDSISDPLNTASFYSFMLGVTTSGAGALKLGKSIGAGVNGLVPDFLNTMAIPFEIIGSDIALQVDWVFDAIQFAGTKITARWKNGTDFTGLTDVFEQVDTISPLTASAAEGLGALTGTGTNDWTMFFDDTSLFDLVPV